MGQSAQPANPTGPGRPTPGLHMPPPPGTLTAHPTHPHDSSSPLCTRPRSRSGQRPCARRRSPCARPMPPVVTRSPRRRLDLAASTPDATIAFLLAGAVVPDSASTPAATSLRLTVRPRPPLFPLHRRRRPRARTRAHRRAPPAACSHSLP